MTLRGDLYADGSIFARHITAGSVTAANGAIDALAVKSLNIGDNAVTVPVSQSLFVAENGNGSFKLVSQVSLFIDTTGLAGKVISILCIFNGSLGWISATPTAGMLTASGPGGSITMQNVASSGSIFPTLDMSGVYSYVASGGVDGVTVFAYWLGGSGAQIGSRTLTALVVKR